MALSVDQAVAEVVSRLRALLATSGISAIPDHTNADVAPAVRDALAYFGLAPSAYPAVSDTDLAALTDPRWFIEAATLETLYRVQVGSLKVDQKVDKNEQKLSQRHGQVMALIAMYQARVPTLRPTRPAVGQLNDPLIQPGVLPLPPRVPTPMVPPYQPAYGPFYGPWGFP